MLPTLPHRALGLESAQFVDAWLGSLRVVLALLVDAAVAVWVAADRSRMVKRWCDGLRDGDSPIGIVCR